MKSILWIHGANCTNLSFKYLSSKTNTKNIFLNYDVEDGIENTIQTAFNYIEKDNPDLIIGHSLGGVIAVLASEKSNKSHNIITLASPFGGSLAADVLKYLTNSRLMRDIGIFSPAIREIASISKPRVPVFSFVATSGTINKLMPEPNDGVVTVSSQKSLQNSTYIELNVNHHEILQHDDVEAFIKKLI